MAGEPLRDERPRPSGSTRPASPAKWQKLGTIERLIRYRGGANGTPSLGEKGVGACMLTYASTAHADPYVSVGELRIAEDLGIDARSVRRYIRRLEERGWVASRRTRRNDSVRYYIAGLVQAMSIEEPAAEPESKVIDFAERTGQVVRSEQPSQNDAGPDTLSGRADKLSGPDRTDLHADRTTCPVPIELIELEDQLRRTHSEHAVLADRLGEKIERNDDGSVHVPFFAHRPRRFAAAHLIVAQLDEWGLTKRRVRKVWKDYGFRAVAGAVAYVRERMAAADQASLLSPEQIRKLGAEPTEVPAARFETALRCEWSCALPGFEDDPYSPRSGGTSFEEDLWSWLIGMLPHHVPPATFETALKRAKLRTDGRTFTFVVATSFAIKIAREGLDGIQHCLAMIGYPNAIVTFTSESQ